MTTTNASPSHQLVGEGLNLSISKPKPHQAAKINELIARCKPLDENSLYCNLLQTTHFAETCAIAEIDGEVAAFVSGYIHPERPKTLFIWQVAVNPDYRGLGLAKKLILKIVERNLPKLQFEFIHTTITKSNTASWSLFKSVAKALNSEYSTRVMFDKQLHLDHQGESEWLMDIGPFQANND